jgi:16S rRNA (guanine966-N2)-methyltransferase
MRAVRPGTIRVIAGSRRGRRLKVPGKGEVRPTSDRVRESIFDVLGPIGGLRVVDLFAGSGAMGIEALSREAAHCVFVESDPQVVPVLRSNIAGLGFAPDSYEVVCADYRRAARRWGGGGANDLLFVDPPYRMLPEVEEALGPLLPSLLTDDGIVVVEAHRQVLVNMGADRVFDRVYGDTRVVMLTVRRNVR